MRLGEKVAGLVQMNDCIVLSGDLGAGKTQFAKGFAAGLGVDLPLLHFDLYRLDEEDELTDIDFFGLLESGGVCLIEWGDKFAAAMPEDRVDVRILVSDDETRTVDISGNGARGAQLEAQLAKVLDIAS